MNDPVKMMFADVKKLCVTTAAQIDSIAKKHNINQNMVAKLFMTVFNSIIRNLEENDDENKN